MPVLSAAFVAYRVAVLASGRGSNLQALLDHARAGRVAARVSLVVSDKPEAGALERARRSNVPAVAALPKTPAETAAAFDARLADLLTGEAPDLIVLAGYMRIVGPKVLAAFHGRIVNIHPSLLPAFPGLHAVRQAHEAGAARVGCTTHLVTEALDGGPVLLQASLRRREGETVQQLQRRVLRLEHLILPRTVDLLARGELLWRDGKPVLRPSGSWLARRDIEFVSGAWYAGGF